MKVHKPKSLSFNSSWDLSTSRGLNEPNDKLEALPKKVWFEKKKEVETFGEKVWICHKFCDLPRVGEITWKENCGEVGCWDWGRSGEANQVENQPNDTNSLINYYFSDLGNPKGHVGTCENFANNVALAKWSKQGFIGGFDRSNLSQWKGKEWCLHTSKPKPWNPSLWRMWGPKECVNGLSNWRVILKHRYRLA